MINNNFRKWLIEKVRYSNRSANDAASRCRRVEKLLNVELNVVVRTEKGFEMMRERLRKGKNSYFKPGINIGKAIDTLIRAVKLYHQFLNWTTGQPPARDTSSLRS